MQWLLTSKTAPPPTGMQHSSLVSVSIPVCYVATSKFGTYATVEEGGGCSAGAYCLAMMRVLKRSTLCSVHSGGVQMVPLASRQNEEVL